MLIEIVGEETYKRESVLRSVKEAVLGLDSKDKVSIRIVDDPREMEKKAFLYPGLMIDGKLVCDGRIPTPEEVRRWVIRTRTGNVVDLGSISKKK